MFISPIGLINVVYTWLACISLISQARGAKIFSLFSKSSVHHDARSGSHNSECCNGVTGVFFMLTIRKIGLFVYFFSILERNSFHSAIVSCVMNNKIPSKEGKCISKKISFYKVNFKSKCSL